MIWLDIVRRFWKPLAAVALIIGAWAWAHHTGYESGYAASEAHWRPAFDEATRARDAANAKARQTESDSSALSSQTEKAHGEQIASLNLRAADAEHRYASLLRQHPANSCRGAVRENGGATPESDAAGASSELIDRTSRDFAALARRCESDAAALTDLQGWIRGQQVILRAAQ